MIRNYITVAFRNIFRNKLTSFINIVGLALAMACALLIYLYIADEVTYDQYHSKSDRIYRVTRDFLSPDGSVNLRLANVAPPIGPLMKNDYGEIETLARTINYGLVIGLEENGELVKSFSEDNLFITEPDIFGIFDIEVIQGSVPAALERPFTVMLSEKAAARFFEEGTDILGRQLRANNQFDLEITGVFSNLSPQSHWHPEFLVSFSTMENENVYGRNNLETNWGNNAFGTYFLLEEGVDPQSLEGMLPDFLDKHFGPYAIANYGVPPTFVASAVTQLHVQKVTDIHLHSHLDDELEINGNINNVYMMSVIGLFILLIACFNFINLSTARATKRSREVGLRKVVGAVRTQLVFQYLSESVVIALLALILAVGLAFIGLGWLNPFTGKDLFPGNPLLLVGLLFAAIIIGSLAGIYPAFIVSGFKPALTLKGQAGSVKGNRWIRKFLVVTQFSVSISLIIATAVTILQLKYLNTRELGFNKDQVITLPAYGEINDVYDAFYNEMTRSSLIGNVGRSSRIPTGRLLDSQGPPALQLGDSLVNTQVVTTNVAVDYEFFPTYGIAFAAGRNFSSSIPTDDSLGFVVNETAARAYGITDMQDAIGKDFQYGGRLGKLIGIVSDFHFESLHQDIIPMVFHMSQSGGYGNLSVQISGSQFNEGVAYMEQMWKTFAPGRPFQYQFMSERYRQLYEAEQKESQLFSIFSVMAILIACLGLFGLATFNVLQRVKEIGIRKVLGASVPSILTLLSREIVILIVLSNLVAWPVAWYFMNKWLGSFAYHIELNVMVFLMAGVVAVAIGLLTVSSQTIKAALMNPSDTLRYE